LLSRLPPLQCTSSPTAKLARDCLRGFLPPSVLFNSVGADSAGFIEAVGASDCCRTVDSAVFMQNDSFKGAAITSHVTVKVERSHDGNRQSRRQELGARVVLSPQAPLTATTGTFTPDYASSVSALTMNYVCMSTASHRHERRTNSPIFTAAAHRWSQPIIASRDHPQKLSC